MPCEGEDCSKLYREHAASVKAQLVASGIDPDAAEDAVQDAFLRILKAAATGTLDLDRVRNVRAWLFAVARNAAADEFRRRRVSVEPGADPDDVASEPSNPVEDEDEHRLVEAEVHLLPAALREPVRLHWWRGCPCPRIAAQMGITANAVYIRLHRAYALLRKTLKPPER
jgi:RNA polymerase sigma-70 factor (ECF subfamily)